MIGPRVEEDPVELFKDFLWSFADRDGELKYQQAVGRMIMAEQRSLVVDFDDLVAYNPSLASRVTDEPDRALPLLSSALEAVVKTVRRDYVERAGRLFVRCRGAGLSTSIRKVDASLIGKMVNFTGVVTRASAVKAYIAEGCYECPSCGQTVVSPTAVLTCVKCGHRTKLVEERSLFDNVQLLVVQEETSALSGGRMPRAIEVVLRGDLVDTVKPGDRVSVSGVVRPKKVRSLYDLYVDANSSSPWSRSPRTWR